MRLALFEPDIPQNTGTMIRSAACFDFSVDIIEPCGFLFSDKKMRRAGMDYLDQVEIKQHASWESFVGQKTGRLILLTTKTDKAYGDFEFLSNDCLIVGRESSGVPQKVVDQVDDLITIPMNAACRSLNVSIAAGIIMADARQKVGWK